VSLRLKSTTRARPDPREPARTFSRDPGRRPRSPTKSVRVRLVEFRHGPDRTRPDISAPATRPVGAVVGWQLAGPYKIPLRGPAATRHECDDEMASEIDNNYELVAACTAAIVSSLSAATLIVSNEKTSTLDVGQKIHPAEILDPARPAKHWARCNQENSRPPRATLPVQTSTTNFVCASIFSRPPRCHGPDQTHGQSPYMSRLNGPSGLCRRPALTNGVSRRSGSFGSARVRAGPCGSVWVRSGPVGSL